MHVAIPFYMETIANSFGQPERMWGRAVANHEFVRALAASPHVRLTLFVPTRRDQATLQRTLLADIPQQVRTVPFGEIATFLAAEPLDVLHVLDPNLWIGAHIRSRLSPAPFVLTGMTHSLANEHFLNWALLNSANGVHAGDCLVCTTPTAQAVVDGVLARLGSGQPGFSAPRTAVIPLGVPGAGAGAGKAGGMSRVELGADDGDFVVLSLARFNPQFKMDLLPLLNLASLLVRDVRRPVRLVLAGAGDNGAYARFIRDRIEERGLTRTVRLVTDVSDEDKQALFRLADVFLSLSDNVQETFGLTVVEALAAGLPVVASDWDGYRALVGDGTTGFLVPTRTLAPDSRWESTLAIQLDSLVHMFGAQATAVDLDVAAERLARLAADPALATRLGQAAAASTVPFAWAQVIGRYVELWSGLVAADPSGRSSALAFLADFAGYATAALAPGDRFRTSRLGTVLLAGKSTINLYEHTDEFLDLKLMEELLRQFSTECTVADATARLADGNARKVAQNILWLYKYGYLSSATGAGRSA